MKNKIVFLLIIVLIFAILYNCPNKIPYESKLFPNNNDSFPQISKVNDITVESKILYGDYSVIAAHYPKFHIDSIDSIITDLISRYIIIFETHFKDSILLDKNYKSELNIDYEISIGIKNIVYIKFTILENTSYYPHPHITIEELAFDLNNNKQLDINSDIFNTFILETFSPLEVIENESTLEPPLDDIKEMVTSRIIDTRKPMVALTFDDGPYSRATISILDTLKKHNSVATFFVLGNRVQNNKNLLIRMIEEGSEIGNHSFNHKQLTTLTSKELKFQIDKTQKSILDIVGSEPTMLRPTYGSYDNKLKESINMPLILWSINPMDWKYRDANKIRNHVLSRVKDGDIVLMHDIFTTTADAVEQFVPKLISRGFQLVTVSELYEINGRSLEVGNIYHNLRQR